MVRVDLKYTWNRHSGAFRVRLGNETCPSRFASCEPIRPNVPVTAWKKAQRFMVICIVNVTSVGSS